MKSAREKERLLVQRHICTVRKRHAQEEMRRMDNSETITSVLPEMKDWH